MSKLRISYQLLLPKDTVTSTLIVYGGKGMGKTNFGAVLVEELSKLNLRWCALDPLGVWWGLRYSQDGKSTGIECVILGGSHADFPIEPTGGSIVADMVVDETANFIIDFSRKLSGEMWSIGEKIRFITDYAYRLFQRQGELVGGVRREPIFQLLDEAARYIPQIIPAGNPQLAQCVAAWEQLVEEGRNIGIGVGLLTQRSARMNKSVSEVADAILSFRIVGPNSIGAIMDWLGEHVPKERIKAMIEEVRSLERGSCLVVSPGWLQFEGVIKIRERQTFDSSATPKPGERARRVSGEGAKPDLAKYAGRMLASIERAKANDPKELKAEVARLKGELAKKPAAITPHTAAPAKPSATELRAIEQLRATVEEIMRFTAKVTAFGFEQTKINPKQLEQAVLKAVEEVGKQVAAASEVRSREFDALKKEATALLKRMERIVDKKVDISVDVIRAQPPFVLGSGKAHAPTPAPAPVRTQTPMTRTASAPSDGNGELSGPQVEMLRRLSEFHSIGRDWVNLAWLAASLSTTVRSRGFEENLRKVRQLGYVDVSNARAKLTGDGSAIAGEPSSPPDVKSKVKEMLSGPQTQLLETLDEVYPRAMPLEVLATTHGTTVRARGFEENLRFLRSNEIVVVANGAAARAEWVA